MARVLANGNTSVREAFVWAHHAPLPVGAPCPLVAAVVPGLARVCNYTALTRHFVAPCVQGIATLTVVLQDYGDDGLFEACAATFRTAVQGTQCSLLLVRQWFIQTSAEPFCAAELAAARRPLRLEARKYTAKRFGRVFVQTLAVGRAWEWARAFHPSAAAYARVRLDSLWGAWTSPSARAPDLLITDSNTYAEDSDDGARFAGDMYAFMDARSGAAYFEAWRGWKAVRCTSVCGAGSATSACYFYLIAQRCTGETALTARLCETLGGSNASQVAAPAGSPPPVRPRWRRADRTPFPYLFAVNATHVRYRHSKAISPEAAVALLDARRKAVWGRADDTCVPCWLPGPRHISGLQPEIKPRLTREVLDSQCAQGDFIRRQCLFEAQHRDHHARVQLAAAAAHRSGDALGAAEAA